MNPEKLTKISFKIDDQVVWCPRGPNNVSVVSTSSAVISTPYVSVQSTVSTTYNQPLMCTGVRYHPRPPPRGLDGVVLHTSEEFGAPTVQVQYRDGMVEKIYYPEAKLRPLSNCSDCPYRLYRITAECPGDPDLIKHESQGV